MASNGPTELQAVGTGSIVKTVLPLIGFNTPGTRAGESLPAVLSKLAETRDPHLWDTQHEGIAHKPLMPSARK